MMMTQQQTMFDIFRNDDYGLSFYLQKAGKTKVAALTDGKALLDGISARVEQSEEDGLFRISVSISAKKTIEAERFGMRLGIDCFMERYPEWNDKFFPTAIRVERRGLWGCFVTPNGAKLAIASPDLIASYRLEYNKAWGDVGHRVYTASVEFFNGLKLPERHPQGLSTLEAGREYRYELYFGYVETLSELQAFVKKHAGISVPSFTKYTLEEGEVAEELAGRVLINEEGKKFRADQPLIGGRYIVEGAEEKEAEARLFVRKEWWYYLNAARRSAEVCQQKIGTHTESWYGYFSLIAYAKYARDAAYTAWLIKKFDAFFKSTTKGRKVKKLRPNALPHRLQNCSGMISLLADMYELTADEKYLDYADDFAAWLMSLQSRDGSYRSHGTHYTCVIYPAKSMLELAEQEKAAGREDKYRAHYDSAERAIKNLYAKMDDIETEGQMTFEDGMISCEALQLGYYALTLSDPKARNDYALAAETLLEKHRCLEQTFIPDARTKGATYRFWEARYDINMQANFCNTPHGWTSWKNYATYYAYLLTAKKEYLIDTMNTLGACMQTVDEHGVLRWAFAFDPCIEAKKMVPSNNKSGVDFVPTAVSEEYLPMVSDWYRQKENKLIFQYVINFHQMRKKGRDYGGSCDNDVHEHFKCMEETVFGKIFLHETEADKWLVYNAKQVADGFTVADPFVVEAVVYSLSSKKVVINQKSYEVKPGIQIIRL